MTQKKFIITQDKEMASKLSTTFKQINNTNGMWVFLNEKPTAFLFSEVDKKKIVFTNTLCI